MRLCDDAHDEIVYEGRDCPVCEAMKERDSFEDKLADARETIEELNSQINDLEARVSELEKEES